MTRQAQRFRHFVNSEAKDDKRLVRARTGQIRPARNEERRLLRV